MFAFITEGDGTSHGGTVGPCSPISLVGGKAVARIGDQVSCRKCGGTFAITTSKNPSITFGGISAAFHGDKTSCGATLISNQYISAGNVPPGPAGDGSSGPPSAADAAAATAAVATTAPTICLECLKDASDSGASTVVRE